MAESGIQRREIAAPDDRNRRERRPDRRRDLDRGRDLRPRHHGHADQGVRPRAPAPPAPRRRSARGCRRGSARGGGPRARRPGSARTAAAACCRGGTCSGFTSSTAPASCDCGEGVSDCMGAKRGERRTTDRQSRMERARRFCRRLFHRVYHPYALRQIAKPVTRLRGPYVVDRSGSLSPRLFPLHAGVPRLSVHRRGRGQAAARHGHRFGHDRHLRGQPGRPGHRLRHQPARGVAGRRERAPQRRRDGGARRRTCSRRWVGAASTSSVSTCRSTRASRDRSSSTRCTAARTSRPIRAFAEGCRRALAPGGTVAVIFSEDSGHDRIVSLFTRGRASWRSTSARAHRYFERFHLLRLQVPSAPPAEQHR